MSTVTVYGKTDCADTARTRDHLLALGVAYEYIDVARNSEAARRVQEWNGGELKTPTVTLDGLRKTCDTRSVLPVPDNTTLDAELDRQGLLPLSAEGDGSIGV